jgi:hypothetical protein
MPDCSGAGAEASGAGDSVGFDLLQAASPASRHSSSVAIVAEVRIFISDVS